MNTEPGQVTRAQRAFQRGGDTRKLKAELAKGNPYALAKLARLGLEYQNGTIIRCTRSDA